MLFLNAGYSQVGALEDIDNYEVEKMVACNATQVAYLGKVMLKQMLKREQRSAIVVVSSVAGTFPMAGILTYSSTKVFASYFAEALSYEVEDRMDVMSW